MVFFRCGNPTFFHLPLVVNLTYAIYTKQSKGSGTNVHCIMEFRKIIREKSGKNQGILFQWNAGNTVPVGRSNFKKYVHLTLFSFYSTELISVSGSLFAANCDDNLTVYYDGVKQMPYQGAGNIEDYNRASHFMMDRYNGPLCNRPSLVTIVCEELFGSMGGIIASNRQEFVTDGSWDCMR